MNAGQNPPITPLDSIRRKLRRVAPSALAWPSRPKFQQRGFDFISGRKRQGRSKRSGSHRVLSASIQPRTSALGIASIATPRRSVAAQKSLPPRSMTRARPRSEKFPMKNARHSSTGGSGIRVSSASCNSSASRTSGQDSADTCAIAQDREVRRLGHIRAERRGEAEPHVPASSRGASSR